MPTVERSILTVVAWAAGAVVSGRADSRSVLPNKKDEGTTIVRNSNSNAKHGRVLIVTQLSHDEDTCMT